MKKTIVLVLFCFVLGIQVVSADIPIDVTISANGSNIDLLWANSPNSDKFYIYRSANPNSGFVKIDSSFTTSYTDIGGGNGLKYFYYVTAIQVPNTVTDIDDNVYQTLVFGNQEWMIENLKVTRYNNGDLIPNVTDNLTWGGSFTGAYCVYDNDPINAETYGNLYNCYAVDDARGLAPVGWHIPTDEEIKLLEIYLGMSESEANNDGWRGTNEGSKMAGRDDLWLDGILDSNPEFGSSGFNLLPGGFRVYNNGVFRNMGHSAYFWSSTEITSGYGWYRYFYFDHTGVYRSNRIKRTGYSVRCVKD